MPAELARSSALKRVVTTFFSGSPLQAALALLSDSSLEPDELAALEAAIADAKAEGR